MKLLGIRFCTVTPEAEALARFLGPDGLGLTPRDMSLPEGESLPPGVDPDGFLGAVFPMEGDGESWVEVWPESGGMPAGTMLQLVVDDADAWAARAKENGLSPMGPTDAHGERIYFVQAPGGMPITFQSKIG